MLVMFISVANFMCILLLFILRHRQHALFINEPQPFEPEIESQIEVLGPNSSQVG
jgi:hypothetical protein